MSKPLFYQFHGDVMTGKHKNTDDNFMALANTVQDMKRGAARGRTWDDRADMLYAIDMIIIEIARISCGNPDMVERWRAIESYASLIACRLNEEEARI